MSALGIQIIAFFRFASFKSMHFFDKKKMAKIPNIP